jgi:integrase
MREGNKLTALKVAKLAREKRIGWEADGHNLYLKDGSSWVFRYMLAKQARMMGLGPVHTVSLQEARIRARQARQLLLEGRDPLAIKLDAITETKLETAKTITFKQAALDFLASDKVEQFKSEVHRKQWHSTLAKVFPTLGDLPVQAIDSAIVLQALLPIWKKTPETGSRLRGRMERVFAYAKAHKLFDGENPASRDVLRDALPTKRKAGHHSSMPYAELGAFMGQLRERESLSAKALEFTILTASRTNETIGMEWSEIDFAAKTWTIPAERMKAGKEHRVPLSDRAIAVLASVPRNGSAMIFPLSNMAMLQLLKGMDANGYTAHGFRSTFMDWAHDCTSYPKHVIDMALAHTIGDKVEAAYRRSDLFAKRAKLMQAWADYCERPAVNADNVTPLRGNAS